MYDIVVIGAGVVGSYIAGEIARLGHSVCVLEKHARPGSKTFCTGIVSSECTTLLDIDRSIVQAEAHSAKIFAPSGHYIKVERDNTQAYILDRPALDNYLTAKAQALGAEFHFSTTASEILKEPKRLIIQARRHAETLQIQARSVIVASGFSTTLTGSTGLGQIHDFARGAQMEVACNNINEVEVYTGRDLAPGFFAWLVPIGNGRAKAGLLCKEDARLYAGKFLHRLAEQGKIQGTEYQVSYGTIPLKPLPRTYGERILVVGDAAGQVKPTTGGGIYFGLLCARIAVDTLHKALENNDLSAKRLSGYQKGWHRILRQELAIDYWAHSFYGRLNDRQIEHIFKIIEHHGIHESILTSPDITFDWHSKVILDVIKHRSLQRAMEKLGIELVPVKKNQLTSLLSRQKST